MHARLSGSRQAGTRPARPGPWPSVESRRCTPTVLAAGRRPLYVRGRRDTGTYSATRWHMTGQRRNGPRSREFPASGPFSQVVAGPGFEPGRRSRRFYRPALLLEAQGTDQRIRAPRSNSGPLPSAMRPWAPGLFHGRGRKTHGRGRWERLHPDHPPGSLPLTWHFRMPLLDVIVSLVIGFQVRSEASSAPRASVIRLFAASACTSVRLAEPTWRRTATRMTRRRVQHRISALPASPGPTSPSRLTSSSARVNQISRYRAPTGVQPQPAPGPPRRSRWPPSRAPPGSSRRAELISRRRGLFPGWIARR